MEDNEIREARREPAETFYARLSANGSTDIELEAVIRKERVPHAGPEL